MSNAWFHYVFPLLTSVVFVTASVLVLRSADRRRVGAGCFLIVFGGVGGALGLAILLTSPTPWQRERIYNSVLHTPPERIERYVLLPGHENEYSALTKKRVVIDDRARIEHIAAILNASSEISPNHPQTRWTATVEVATRDGSYYFSVLATEPGDTNGTLVSPETSDQAGGWNLGHVQANGLEKIIEEAVVASND